MKLSEALYYSQEHNQRATKLTGRLRKQARKLCDQLYNKVARLMKLKIKQLYGVEPEVELYDSDAEVTARPLYSDSEWKRKIRIFYTYSVDVLYWLNKKYDQRMDVEVALRISFKAPTNQEDVVGSAVEQLERHLKHRLRIDFDEEDGQLKLHSLHSQPEKLLARPGIQTYVAIVYASEELSKEEVEKRV